MSTNPHAINREPGQSGSNHNNNIDTPLTALPSRFMSDNLLPSPSSFYPEWNLGRLTSAAGDMSAGGLGVLPSPLNFGGGSSTAAPPTSIGTKRDEDSTSQESAVGKKRPASGPAEEDEKRSGSANESSAGSGGTGSESDAKRVKT
jgi:MADS-box transcription factor